MMHVEDRAYLERLAGGEISDATEFLYSKFEMAHMMVSNGPMEHWLLIVVAAMSDGVQIPERVKSEWDEVEPNTAVIVQHPFEARDMLEGTFLRVGEGIQTGQLEVACFEDKTERRWFPADRVRLATAPAPIPVDTRTAEERVAEEFVPLTPDLDWKDAEEGIPVRLIDKDSGDVLQGKFLGMQGDDLKIRVVGKHKTSSFGVYPATEVRPVRELV